jgi:hypothetical protein
LRETLYRTTADGQEPEAVRVHGAQIHPVHFTNELDYVHYLFTLQDIAFDEVLPAWLKLHARAWLPLGMLFGLRYIPEGYVSTRLLTAATAAEALHRELRKDTAGTGQRPTLRGRLVDIAGIPDPVAVATLIPDIDSWADYLKDARHGIAHGDRTRLSPDDAKRDFDVLAATMALLELVLLAELGLPATVQRRSALLLQR